MRYSFILGLVLAQWASPPEAHEFWVEPRLFHVAVGSEITLDLKVGQMLEGQSYPYLSHKFGRYQATDASGVHDLIGDEGDMPSIVYDATVPGLHVISYHALAEQVTYDEFQDFAEFVAEEGLSSAVEQHRTRGLPETGFTEAYTRYAKALIQVGPPTEGNTDQATGMAFELVALSNPYLTATNLPVKLLWNDVELPNAQVAVFRRSGDEVTRTTYQTDAHGIATIQLPGDGVYLLSSVQIEESAEDSGEVWHSLWASLTFAVGQVGAP